MSASIKKRRFVATRTIELWKIEHVPGIGSAIGSRLRRNGITNAGTLLDEYRSRTKAQFMKYIEKHGGNVAHQRDAYYSLRDWKKRHTGR